MARGERIDERVTKSWWGIPANDPFAYMLIRVTISNGVTNHAGSADWLGAGSSNRGLRTDHRDYDITYFLTPPDGLGG